MMARRIAGADGDPFAYSPFSYDDQSIEQPPTLEEQLGTVGRLRRAVEKLRSEKEILLSALREIRAAAPANEPVVTHRFLSETSAQQYGERVGRWEAG